MTAPVVLITGAARRVGAEIAHTLHAAGASVALHYRSSRDDAVKLAASLNALRPKSADIFTADLGDPGSLVGMIDAVAARFGHLDGLVNNASSFFSTPISRIDEAAWQELVGSNFKGPLFLSQAAAPLLAAQRGAIVNITDIHCERPLKGYVLYTSAKSALAGMTHALAIDLAPHVRVNAVAPGAILWPEDDSFSVQQRASIVANTPLQRAGTPEDVARTVKFLLFDAPYITGQTINVDGGRSIHI